ncbi:hypothetical protein [Amycolatopsis sp. NBC_01286]|uniref:hypothetical protein n=2 Tax=unclassified Amycolatopsis TaxID=2618356 RepID=UPI002E0FB2CE|nr:hypothetical protein OG570_40275 [Amycolatopsis sp. NBC_01286]
MHCGKATLAVDGLRVFCADVTEVMAQWEIALRQDKRLVTGLLERIALTLVDDDPEDLLGKRAADDAFWIEMDQFMDDLTKLLAGNVPE